MKETTKQYDGFHGLLTIVASVVVIVIFLFCILYLYLPKTLSVIIIAMIYPFLAFQKVKLIISKTKLTVKGKPAFLPFYVSKKTILADDIQSYNIFDMDRGNKLRGQHYKLRITTFDEKNYMVGIYLQGKTDDLLRAMEIAAPGKKIEIEYDLECIKKRQTLLRLRFWFVIGMLLLSFMLLLFIFLYIFSL